MDQIELFIEKISKIELNNNNATNIYYGDSQESSIKKNNLRIYLKQVKKISPEIILIGEAPGFHGCRITGIPFTSEEILINNKEIFGEGKGFQSINNKEEIEREMSASIVWNELIKYNDIPLIWNIFPFHPHIEGNSRSNRKPTSKEIKLGVEILKDLLDIFEIKKIGAIGRKSENAIKHNLNNYSSYYIRHPSRGGSNLFREHLKRFMNLNDKFVKSKSCYF